MKITAIKQQVKKPGRYSIFVDGKYDFSLSDLALLSSGLVKDQEITQSELDGFKQLSDQDKIYNQSLSYIALRQRSRWEIETYLERKKASNETRTAILAKLENIGLIDDSKFAQAWVNDRQLLKPTSRRKLTLELRQKHISNDLISEALQLLNSDYETNILKDLIKSKRRQTRYQDDNKIMQYLASQGFGYGAIKQALADQ